jgi:5'-hydroxyaverantin dehydrogenase
MMGYIDLPYNTGYAISKFGIRGMFRSIRSQTARFNVRVNNIAPAYILTPLTKKIHKIDDPSQPSKATGYVLPWADIKHVVDAAGRCAVDEEVHGRTWSVSRSGYVDMKEEVETGYGGTGYLEVLERDGLMDIPSLFPHKAGR